MILDERLSFPEDNLVSIRFLERLHLAVPSLSQVKKARHSSPEQSKEGLKKRHRAYSNMYFLLSSFSLFFPSAPFPLS